MAEQRDMLDELIDIQRDWQALSNPLGGVIDTLAADPSKVEEWDPSKYKEVPRANSAMCLQVSSGCVDACTLCTDACPTDAIKIEGKRVTVGETCRRCGLCSSVCPTNVFLTTKLPSKVLYDRIARVAGAYNVAYVTCTRALGRLPKGNEVVLPCVGALPAEVWFALLVEYGNLSVYLPQGICDRCRTVTGEDVYVDHIGQAEEWSESPVGLEEDESALDHELSRAYRRSQFVSSMAQAGTTLVTRGVPVLAGAQAVAKRIKDHGQQLLEMQRTLEKAVGAKDDQSHRRVLSQNRKLVLTTLQKFPELASNFELQVPVCDRSLCTMCGDCVKACPLHACSLDGSGRFSVEPTYCLGCGACAQSCIEDALAMEPCDPEELVVPDPNAAKLEERRAEIERKKQEARAQLQKGLDAIERLAD